MKIIFLIVLMSLTACSGKSGKEEKDIATKAFVDCDFNSAITSAEDAINFAGDDVEVIVPALLIIGLSSQYLDREHSAYEKIMALVPDNLPNIKEVEKAASKFVKNLSKMVPDKVKACSQLQS